MNSSISKSQVDAVPNEESMRVGSLERILLLLPIAGGLVFGLFPFLLGGAFGKLLGFSGDDSFIYRLAGAATLGYAVALIMGLRLGDWAPLRLVVIGTMAFNLASIYACVAQLVAGDTNLIIYLILGTSIAITAITLWMLNRHPSGMQMQSELSTWYIRFITLGTVLSGVFGLMPLFTPVLGSHLLGFHGTDVFLIRQAGAASLGYAVIGILVVRSGGAWLEIRLPLVMALIFNGFSFVASVIALFSAEPVLITVVIGAASLFVTIVGMIAYQRQGRL
ncbi:MAG TPA: hypothetical protein VK249_31300 [Anaerolineales bacterium]|nr:hypothetical protein [Anaerolineales bacterium]